VDGSGNVYVAGIEATTGANGAFLAKYNSSGVIQWQRRLHTGTGNTPQFLGIDIGSDGYLYLTGSGVLAATGSDLLVAKYDTSGTIQWQRRLYGPTTTNDSGNVGCLDSSDNLILPATAAGLGTGGAAYLAKYNSSGTLQWQRQLDGAGGSDSFTCACVDESDSIYVCGFTVVSGVFSCIIAKYDSTGAIQWQNTLTDATISYLRGCAIDGDGNLVAVGQFGGTNSEVGVVVKYEPDGTLVWQKAVSPASGRLILTGITTVGNTAWICGYTTGDGAGSDDAFVMKIPTDLNVDGTYGAFSIGALTLTPAAGTLTDSAGSLTGATPTLTSASTSLTAATATLTAELILIE